MTKQRIAEIMNEINEGKEDLKKMDMSVLLLIFENTTSIQVGVADEKGLMTMIVGMILRTARDLGYEVNDFLKLLMGMVLYAKANNWVDKIEDL